MSAATAPVPDLLVEETLPEMEIDRAASGDAAVGADPRRRWGSRVYSSGAPPRGDTRVQCSSRWRVVGTAKSSGDTDGR